MQSVSSPLSERIPLTKPKKKDYLFSVLLVSWQRQRMVILTSLRIKLYSNIEDRNLSRFGDEPDRIQVDFQNVRIV